MIPIRYRGTCDKQLDTFCDKLQKKIATWLANSYVGDGRGMVFMNTDARRFFTQLNTPDAIKTLVNKSPADIRTYISDMERDYPVLVTDRNAKDANPQAPVSRLYECIEKAFSNYGYDSSLFPKDGIQEDLGLTACPYCNRNFIKIIKVTNRKRVEESGPKGQLDHFFPRALYPYLAICKYNLVPCCPTCNGSSGKHDKDTRAKKVVNPYELQNADGLRFKMNVAGGEILNLEHCAQGISISVDTSLNPNMDNNEEIFHLKQIYQTHTDYAAEIYIKKVMKENGIYLKFTKDMLKKHHIRLTNDDVRRILHGFYTNPNDFSKRPLSKFRTDLAKDLGLL